MIKLIVFDLDNTLLDRDTSFRRFAEWIYDTYLVINKNKEQIIEGMIEVDKQGYGPKEKVWSYLNEQGEWKIGLDAEGYQRCFLEHMADFSVAMDGTYEVLQELLDSGYRLGMITNGKTEGQNRKINALGIRKYFEHIIISEEAGVKKPEKEIFNRLLDAYNLKPDEAIYVGDSPKNDVYGARMAGMHSIWMSYRKKSWDQQIVVDKFHEIKSLKEVRKAVPVN